MRPRDLLLRASVLTLLAAAAITLLGDPTVAGELPPPSGPETAPFEVESHGDAPGAIAEAGTVRPVVHRVFSATAEDGAVQAHQLMESSTHVGKIMLAW